MVWDSAAAAGLKKLILSRFRSIRAAARAMCVDHSNLARVLRGETPPSAFLLERLAGVGISLSLSKEKTPGVEKIFHFITQPRSFLEATQQDRELVKFSDPRCPAWRFAKETALEWHKNQQKFWGIRDKTKCPCLRFDTTAAEAWVFTRSSLPFYPCTPFENFVINVIGFFQIGGVTSPAAARGLLKVLLGDFRDSSFVDWVENEVAQDVIARCLFFHAILYTMDPFLYILEGGVLQIYPGIRFPNAEAIVPVPRFGIEKVKDFVNREKQEADDNSFGNDVLF